MKLQIIDWLDHTDRNGWMSAEEVRSVKPAVATSVGWVFEEDDVAVKLISCTAVDATDEDDDKNMGCMQLIVKSCIVKRRTLRP